MFHQPSHMIVSAAALVVALAISSFTVNRLVRRKLRLSVLLLGAYLLFHVVLALTPLTMAWEGRPEVLTLERLALTAAIINLVVVTLINPLRVDRVPDRFPAIVQDAAVIGLLILVATVGFGDEFLAASALSAVVIGLALQDTLGNAFAGLAIQSEKPFNVGHWVRCGDHEGRVAEVTWRATKLRTKEGNFVIVPNSEVAKVAITNYSEPAAPTRLFVDVGVSYDALPNHVKRVFRDALRNAPLVLEGPAPEVVLWSFDASSITYRAYFWLEDFQFDDQARDQVRSAIYYAFRREGIEIPYPIQVEYSREPAPPADGGVEGRERVIGQLDLFASLTAEQRRMIAAAIRTLDFADGECIVRQGDPGDSIYIVQHGRVTVVTEPGRNPVATIGVNGYFGEMSLLTGEPRAATVLASGDTRVLEITAEVFRQLAEASPQTVEQIGTAAATRRVALDEARTSAATAVVTAAPATFIARMRRFLRMG